MNIQFNIKDKKGEIITDGILSDLRAFTDSWNGDVWFQQGDRILGKKVSNKCFAYDKDSK